jgi:predicted secreted hydrolase
VNLLLALALLLVTPEYPFRTALPSYQYQFPRDYFEHPEFKTEWWYYTGNLRSAEGRRFGFELVFFRQAQHRPMTSESSPNHSAWRIDDLYLAHLALTDINGKKFRSYRRLNRAGPGIAGASFEQRRIWNGNWSAQWNGNLQSLDAVAEDFRFSLKLNPLKPVATHGLNGISQKSEGAGHASHYISFPRLDVTGSLNTGGLTYQITGSAWMDHEWFTHQLNPSQAGWDWFSVQLDDARELMLFQLRRKDGSIDPYSAGTYVDRQGVTRHLSSRDFSLQPIGHWISPKTKVKYPVRWRLEIPSLALSLECTAALDDQELASTNASEPNYWEGAVRYSGSTRGVGYLEMTGYDNRPLPQF